MIFVILYPPCGGEAEANCMCILSLLLEKSSEIFCDQIYNGERACFKECEHGAAGG